MPYCKTVEFLPISGLPRVVRLGLTAVLRDEKAETVFSQIKALEQRNDPLMKSLWYQKMTTLLVVRFQARSENRRLVFDAPLLSPSEVDWLLFYLKIDKGYFSEAKLYLAPKGVDNGVLLKTTALQELELVEEMDFYTRRFPIKDLLLKLANSSKNTTVKIGFFRDHEKIVARSTVLDHGLNKTFTQSSIVLIEDYPHNLQQMREYNRHLAEAELRSATVRTV